MTLAELIENAAARLGQADLYYGHGTDNAWDEAVWLVLHALGRSPAEPIEDADIVLSEDQQQAAFDWLQRRIDTRKPTAYLTGQAWFCGLPFEVTEDTLIPRSPIAELIQQQFSPWLPRPPQRVLDLCTGGGCIAIACAYAFPDAQVVGTDISEAALAVARRNVAAHQLQGRVQCLSSDVFSNVEGCFDLIVSNPPYVDAEDMAALPAEYRHEPELALASERDGLGITRRILADVGNYLSDDGVLVLEVGNSETALVEAYPDLPFTWLEFEWGGHGVFCLQKSDLI
ncbi:protein-(glutamine-N5) methyltransferase, ribosomal protein L3-specific [gamma proteobacterium HTCC5015]|nr:protein-(glutamine-N5) methyltransferase, ribosomal protein L3-specific [gamma proteobacterium HTCC5015]